MAHRSILLVLQVAMMLFQWLIQLLTTTRSAVLKEDSEESAMFLLVSPRTVGRHQESSIGLVLLLGNLSSQSIQRLMGSGLTINQKSLT